jgi:hypothetical protein
MTHQGVPVRALKLMPDYDCFPLWEEIPDGTRNVDPADLPLDPELRQELLDWADAYDATLDPDYPPDSGFPSPEAEVEFDRQGRDLWRRLVEQLRGAATVSYFSVRDGSLGGP